MALGLTIRGGTVVTTAGTLDRDVGIREGRIAELGKGLKSERSAALEPLGRQVPEMAQLAAWNTPLRLWRPQEPTWPDI